MLIELIVIAIIIFLAIIAIDKLKEIGSIFTSPLGALGDGLGGLSDLGGSVGGSLPF